MTSSTQRKGTRISLNTALETDTFKPAKQKADQVFNVIRSGQIPGLQDVGSIEGSKIATTSHSSEVEILEPKDEEQIKPGSNLLDSSGNAGSQTKEGAHAAGKRSCFDTMTAVAFVVGLILCAVGLLCVFEILPSAILGGITGSSVVAGVGGTFALTVFFKLSCCKPTCCESNPSQPNKPKKEKTGNDPDENLVDLP